MRMDDDDVVSEFRRLQEDLEEIKKRQRFRWEEKAEEERRMGFIEKMRTKSSRQQRSSHAYAQELEAETDCLRQMNALKAEAKYRGLSLD